MKITKFVVNKLHDVFSYNLDFSKNNDISILYGDNGSGKTTLLKLLFHIISPTIKKGHLTAISGIPFSTAMVVFSSGTSIKVVRNNGVMGYPIDFVVESDKKSPAIYSFIPDQHKNDFFQDMYRQDYAKKINSMHKGKGGKNLLSNRRLDLINLVRQSSDESLVDYYNALREFSIDVFFLGTDRRMLNDDIAPLSVNRAIGIENIGSEEQIAKLRTIYLKDTLQRGARHLNRQIINRSNIGSKNVNDIYSEIFTKILNQNFVEQTSDTRDLRSLLVELRLLQRRQRPFVRLGLSPELDVSSFLPNLKSIPDAQKIILEKVLSPFVGTLRARLDALEPIKKSIEIFLRSLNGFFKYKNITYTPSFGFKIFGPLGEELDVEHLSSGEQQLLLIFCSVLASGETPCIFIIDEPEISLNVKWQREILETLSNIQTDSGSHLLISTHSIELLTQHSEKVVALNPVISSSKMQVFNVVSEED